MSHDVWSYMVCKFFRWFADEAEDFNREWETKTRASMNAIGYGGEHRSHSRRPREDLPAIQDRWGYLHRCIVESQENIPPFAFKNERPNPMRHLQRTDRT